MEKYKDDTTGHITTYRRVFNNMSSFRIGTFLFCGIERSEDGNELGKIKKRKNESWGEGTISVPFVGNG